MVLSDDLSNRNVTDRQQLNANLAAQLRLLGGPHDPRGTANSIHSPELIHSRFLILDSPLCLRGVLKAQFIWNYERETNRKYESSSVVAACFTTKRRVGVFHFEINSLCVRAAL